MTLREFVADTLSQIVAGVEDARDKSKQVAPPVTTQGSAYVAYPGGVSFPGAFLVEFDVAVTISKKTDVDTKGGVAVHIFEAAAKRTSSAEHSTVSRIKFEVPVIYDKMA